MKCLNLYFTIFCLLISSSLLAQSPQQIEADLVKSFKKIDQWSQKVNDGKSDVLAANDSLANANDVFARKLKRYTEKVSAIITYSFNSLAKQPISILTSSDDMLRIYSWDTWMGGTTHSFENVFQYKSGEKILAIIDTGKAEGDYVYTYEDIYTFKANSKTYYLATYLGIYSTKDSGRGIKIFTIDNDKLNDDVKLIKTHSGLHDHLYYDYDFFSVVDIPFEKRPTITYDASTQTIRLPLVDANRKVTNKFILYKFTGQYFERVKN